MEQFGFRVEIHVSLRDGTSPVDTEAQWRRGCVVGYNPATARHLVLFDAPSASAQRRPFSVVRHEAVDLVGSSEWRRIPWAGNVLDAAADGGERARVRGSRSEKSYGPTCPGCAHPLGVGASAWLSCDTCGMHRPGMASSLRTHTIRYASAAGAAAPRVPRTAARRGVLQQHAASTAADRSASLTAHDIVEKVGLLYAGTASCAIYQRAVAALFAGTVQHFEHVPALLHGNFYSNLRRLELTPLQRRFANGRYAAPLNRLKRDGFT